MQTPGIVTRHNQRQRAPNSGCPGAIPQRGTWQGLEIVTAELPGAGTSGSGALRYTIHQTGPSQPAAVRAPVVNMAGEWAPGSVNAADLSGTTFRFRYRATGGAQFGLRFDPAFGQEANALSGFRRLAARLKPPFFSKGGKRGARETITVPFPGVQIARLSASPVAFAPLSPQQDFASSMLRPSRG